MVLDQRMNVVGRSTARKDALWKITGEAKFTGDIVLPGMLWGKILRSPYPHARVTAIDIRDAANVPGVKAVLTHENVPNIRYNGHALPPAPQDQRIFDSVVRFVGEPVAAVAAEDESAAELAVEKIHVDYTPLDAIYDPEEAMGPQAPKLHEVSGSNCIYDAGRNLAWYGKVEYGDVEKAFRNAYFVRGPDRYRTAPIHASPLECPSCVADYSYGRLTLWSPTQFVLLKRFWLSKLLDLPVSRVRVRVPYVGGAFGSRTELLRHEIICALLAKRTGRPVKIQLSRYELMSGEGGRRHSSIIDLRIGLSKEGLFTALEAKVITGAGAYCPHGVGVTHNMMNLFHSLYRFPNYRAEGYCAYTNASWAGGFRGYGCTEPTFAIESSIDMSAKELKMDPVELRMRNHVRVGDEIPWSKTVIQTCGLDECIRKGLHEIGWKKGKRSLAGEDSRVMKRGIGLSAITHHTSLGTGRSPLAPIVPVSGKMVAGDSSNAIIKLNDDGTFTLVVNCAELGSGQHTVLSQIASEALGVDINSISIDPEIDSDVVPYDLGPAIDRTTFVTGGAVKVAAEDARNQMLKAAAKILQCEVAGLYLRDGVVLSKTEPENRLALPDLAKLAQSNLGMIVGRGHYSPKSNAPSFGAEFSEVEVDTETGVVKVLRVVGVFDIGRPINPGICESQAYGGIVQGLSTTLLEGLVIDPDTGTTLNSTLMDYSLAGSESIPEMKVFFVETVEPTGPFGAKGMGQIPIDGMSASIANAIYDAVGVRMTELPITPENVLKALKSKKG